MYNLMQHLGKVTQPSFLNHPVKACPQNSHSWLYPFSSSIEWPLLLHKKYKKIDWTNCKNFASFCHYAETIVPQAGLKKSQKSLKQQQHLPFFHKNKPNSAPQPFSFTSKTQEKFWVSFQPSYCQAVVTKFKCPFEGSKQRPTW